MASDLGDTVKRIVKTAGAVLAIALVTSCAASPASTPTETSAGYSSGEATTSHHGKYGSKLQSVLSKADEHGYGEVARISLGLKDDITSVDFLVDGKREPYDLRNGQWELDLDDPSKNSRVGNTISIDKIKGLSEKIDELAVDTLTYAQQRNMLVDSRIFIQSDFKDAPESEFEVDTPVVEFWLYDPAEKLSNGLHPLNYRVYSAENYQLLWQATGADTAVVSDCYWLGAKGDADCVKFRDTFTGS